MEKSSFLSILARSNASIKNDRAVRIANGALRAQQKLLMDLEARREQIIETLEASKDLSTSNDRNALNAIESFNAERWVNTFQENSVDLEVVDRELAIAKTNFDLLFGSHEDDSAELLKQKDPKD